MLAIVDYGAGNQTSVVRSLEFLGVPAVITADVAVLARAQGVIFPGVGSAGQAMARLRASGLDLALAQVVERHQPLLGICLGCQILLSASDEDQTPCLNLIPGHCHPFPQGLREADGSLCRIPHMGWNGLIPRRESRLLQGVPEDAEFYFVHSYYVEPPEELIIATTSYGKEFCSIYGRDGLWAVQFHLEKSGAPGLQMLQNYARYCQEQAHAF